MAHTAPQHLKINNRSFVGTALGTLASLAALSLDSGFGTGLAQSYLLKKVKITFHLDSLPVSEGPLIVGLAKGDATAAEIAQAMTENNAGGDRDTTQSLTEDNVWTVIQSSLVPGIYVRETDTTHYVQFIDDISFGKGIPLRQGQGVQAFIYNPGSTLGTGAIISGIYQLYGVWLRD